MSGVMRFVPPSEIACSSFFLLWDEGSAFVVVLGFSDLKKSNKCLLNVENSVRASIVSSLLEGCGLISMVGMSESLQSRNSWLNTANCRRSSPSIASCIHLMLV